MVSTHTDVVADCTPKMSPASRVLELPELLEPILLYILPLDVFIFQRVNSKWQSVIKGSNSIQEKLFLKATPIENLQDEHGSIDLFDFQWNPFLLKICRQQCIDISRLVHDLYFDLKDLPKDEYAGSAWKKIVVSKPASTNVFVFPQRDAEGCETRYFDEDYVVKPAGGNGDGYVTMSDVADFIGDRIRNGALGWTEVDKDLVGIEQDPSECW